MPANVGSPWRLRPRLEPLRNPCKYCFWSSWKSSRAFMSVLLPLRRTGALTRQRPTAMQTQERRAGEEHIRMENTSDQAGGLQSTCPLPPRTPGATQVLYRQGTPASGVIGGFGRTCGDR